MAATFVATLGESELEVTVRESGPPIWRIRLEDRELELDAVRLPSGSWSVICEGRSLLVDIDRREGGGVIALVDGERIDFVLEDARARRFASMINHASGAGTSGETLRAPIAGKVVKLVANVGDEVEAGDAVIVLEAMKMENELRASRGGTVQSISVAAGDSVETGQVLATLA